MTLIYVFKTHYVYVNTLYIFISIKYFSDMYDGSQPYNSQSLPLSELRKMQLSDDDRSFMNRVKSQGMYLLLRKLSDSN